MTTPTGTEKGFIEPMNWLLFYIVTNLEVFLKSITPEMWLVEWEPFHVSHSWTTEKNDLKLRISDFKKDGNFILLSVERDGQMVSLEEHKQVAKERGFYFNPMNSENCRPLLEKGQMLVLIRQGERPVNVINETDEKLHQFAIFHTALSQAKDLSGMEIPGVYTQWMIERLQILQRIFTPEGVNILQRLIGKMNDRASRFSDAVKNFQMKNVPHFLPHEKEDRITKKEEFRKECPVMYKQFATWVNQTLKNKRLERAEREFVHPLEWYVIASYLMYQVKTQRDWQRFCQACSTNYKACGTPYVVLADLVHQLTKEEEQEAIREAAQGVLEKEA